MHDLEPVNADGEPTYAMSLFKDWDGGTMMAATQFYAIFGYGDQWNYVFPHATEDSYITLLDDLSEISLPGLKMNALTNKAA